MFAAVLVTSVPRQEDEWALACDEQVEQCGGQEAALQHFLQEFTFVNETV